MTLTKEQERKLITMLIVESIQTQPDGTSYMPLSKSIEDILVCFKLLKILCNTEVVHFNGRCFTNNKVFR